MRLGCWAGQFKEAYSDRLKGAILTSRQMRAIDEFRLGTWASGR